MMIKNNACSQWFSYIWLQHEVNRSWVCKQVYSLIFCQARVLLAILLHWFCTSSFISLPPEDRHDIHHVLSRVCWKAGDKMWKLRSRFWSGQVKFDRLRLELVQLQTLIIVTFCAKPANVITVTSQYKYLKKLECIQWVVIYAGDWSSCFEWCLSKPNHCTQLWVEVRRNGSAPSWQGCSNIQDTVCPVADKELVEDTWCENPKEDCKVQHSGQVSLDDNIDVSACQWEVSWAL